MKKLSAVTAILLALILVLSACSDKETPSKTVSEIYSEIESSATLPVMLAMSDDDLFDYWGVDSGIYEDYTFRYADGLSADHIFIAKCTDSAGVAATETFFNNYLDYVTVSLANYNPEEAGKIENAVVKTVGNSVYLVISDDVDAICAIIEAGL